MSEKTEQIVNHDPDPAVAPDAGQYIRVSLMDHIEQCWEEDCFQDTRIEVLTHERRRSAPILRRTRSLLICGLDGRCMTFSAILNPSSPNFEYWLEILGNHRVPLVSPEVHRGKYGAEADIGFYLINLRALTLKQRARFLGFLANRLQVPVYEAEAQINKEGFAIPVGDVIVTKYEEAAG